MSLCSDLSGKAPPKPRRFLYTGTRPDLQAEAVEGTRESENRVEMLRNEIKQQSTAMIPQQESTELAINKVSFVPPNNAR